MDTIYQSLQIVCETSLVLQIDAILGVASNRTGTHGCWRYKAPETDAYYGEDWQFFLKILDGKYDDLKALGVDRSDISIWVERSYDGQCGFEFLPADLLALGANGITLCISCWESGETGVST